MDTLLLSRLQFATNISFHILFPAITIGLVWFLAYFRTRAVQTGDPVWMRCYRFWVKVFALTFALGVVSGITMSFQFGTNWPGFMERVGNIAGPLLGYEVLTAFFMEATFLGVMLFGIHRVPPWLHVAATYCVAIGTTLSAFWIISLNSWMQTPAGYEIRDGVFHAADWLAVIFNPSMPYRLVHVLIASGLTAAFLVMGVSAYRILKGDRKPAPVLATRAAVVVAMVLVPAQILSGDLHGLNTFEHQPAKVAAMEGVWESQQGAPFLLFAWPNEAERRHDVAIGVPHAASLILTHDLQGEVKGLNDFVGEHPPVAPVFWSFRVMLAVGFAMLAVTLWAGWRQLLGRAPSVALLRVMVGMTFSGWVGTLAGWMVSEIGRQPYLVSGLLSTADAVTNQPAASVGLSLTVYVVLYTALLFAYISTLFYLARQSARLEMTDVQVGGELAAPPGCAGGGLAWNLPNLCPLSLPV